MITKISMLAHTGSFAENKDTARHIRLEILNPELDKGNEVHLDFEGITGATQSFIHALLSEIMRQRGADVLDRLVFVRCVPQVQQVIKIVTDYMQQSGAA